MTTIDLDGAIETEECTPQLRWVPYITLRHDRKLQQAWRITVRDKDRRAMGSRIEWRDVPTEINPDRL